MLFILLSISLISILLVLPIADFLWLPGPSAGSPRPTPLSPGPPKAALPPKGNQQATRKAINRQLMVNNILVLVLCAICYTYIYIYYDYHFYYHIICVYANKFRLLSLCFSSSLYAYIYNYIYIYIYTFVCTYNQVSTTQRLDKAPTY